MNDVTATDVATTTTGSGTGLKVTVVCNASNPTINYIINNYRQGYGADDQITIPNANANSNNAVTQL